MPNRFKVNQIMFFTVAALTVSTLVQAEEVKKEDVPRAVVSAFEKSYPHATVKSYEREERGGKTCYEIESIDGRTKRDILYNDSSSALEIEESIEIKQLPEKVHQSFENKYSQGKILSAEKVTQGDVITYELIVQIGKRKIEMEIDPSGKVLTAK